MCKSPSFDRNAGKPSSSSMNYAIDVALVCHFLGFIFFRFVELFLMIRNFPGECMNGFGAILFFMCYIMPVSFGFKDKGLIKLRHITYIATIVSLVVVMDYYLPLRPPVSSDVTSVVVTGANSGVGYETALSLVSRGITVVMGCRSMERCQNAADKINGVSKGEGKAIPLVLDLADFKSVSSFASNVKALKLKTGVDVLFNNAGYVPKKNEPLNKMGLDPGFTSMHLSHHLLTELLLKQNAKLRIVATSSGTHHFCAMPFAILPSFLLNAISLPQNVGCIDEKFLSEDIRLPTKQSAYIEAKCANVMHVAEIPRRHPKATAIAVDLAWVGTSIQPWMQGAITPASLQWMRTASIGINPVLNAILRPTEDFDTENQPREWSNKGGLSIDIYGKVGEPFSYSWYSGKDVNTERMLELSKKLWKETTSILRKNGQKV